MVKIILKVIALPLILILAIVGVILNAGIKLYCLASAFAFKLLGLCALIAVCTSQWKSLLMIGIMVACTLFIAFGASFVMAQIEICRDRLCSYMKA